MSRLTKYCIDGYIARNFNYDSLAEMSAGDCEVFNDVVDKLGRYETLEDKGRLIEVIRCKDCIRKSDEYIAGTDGVGWCDKHEHLIDDDDYCSYADGKLAEIGGAE